MNILLCGKKNDHLMIYKYVKSVFPDAETFFCEDSDKLLQQLTDISLNIAMVLFDGADGMEAAIALRRQLPDVPLIWFSDDIAFAAQAYRLNITYFHNKPITQSILNKALASCGYAITEVR